MTFAPSIFQLFTIWTIDGLPDGAYREFRLDINEPDTDLTRWLSLESLQIWQSDDAAD